MYEEFVSCYFSLLLLGVLSVCNSKTFSFSFPCLMPEYLFQIYNKHKHYSGVCDLLKDSSFNLFSDQEVHRQGTDFLSCGCARSLFASVEHSHLSHELSSMSAIDLSALALVLL